MIGHDFRGFEVALDARVLHELHVAEVGETFTANRVARRIDADGDVDAGQVANGVCVLGTGQPPDSHASGVAGMFCLVALIEDRIHAAVVARSVSVGCSSASSGGIWSVSSISAIFSHCSEWALIENCVTSFSILRPRSCFFELWQSKQYFWKAAGGRAVAAAHAWASAPEPTQRTR